MRKKIFPLLALLSLLSMVGCNDFETYAEMKEKENKAISRLLKDSSVTVISEAQFRQQNYTTDVSKNEYVLLASTGVYMQIVRPGCGEVMKSGETINILCRFTERNILTDSIIITNNVNLTASYADKMRVTRTSDTFTGTFVAGQSVMYSYYSSSVVPPGWLCPLSYVKVGRLKERGDELAKVRLIVPGEQGTETAAGNSTPCFYDITYERGI